MDMDCSRIGAIVPASAFHRLMEGAMTRSQSHSAMLLSEDERERLEVWSCWRQARESNYTVHHIWRIRIQLWKLLEWNCWRPNANYK